MLDLIRKLGIVTKNKQSKNAIELVYRRIFLGLFYALNFGYLHRTHVLQTCLMLWYFNRWIRFVFL